jgi:hypothetical protein
MTADRTEIWNSGGGVQSTAIAVLICQGAIPKPDLAVIVDTERELSTTWDYLDKYTMPALESVGVKLHRVAKSRFAHTDLYSSNGDLLIPAFTTQGGEVGKLRTYCSSEWKVRVMQRWATREQGVVTATNWIGFTIDEKHRIRQPIGKWQNSYPLIEKRLTRGDCIALVKRFGWPEPPRSSCYMCPNKRADEWAWQKKNAPNDHRLAIEFEREMQLEDPEAWLTRSGIPLADVDFSADEDLFDKRCDSGMCFV